MKKIALIISLISCLIVGVVFSANAYTTVTYQTYGVPNSPFKITKQIIKTVNHCGRECGTEITFKYQYYLKVTPESQHQGLQRIEYVGFRVVYQNGFKFFQLFPNGGLRELNDINQALYEPSKIVSNPADVGQYQLFSQPITSNLTGVQVTACLTGGAFLNIPNANTVQGVNFMAGYGFLTQENMNMVAQQKAMESDPIIQAQVPKVKLLDIQTMKWAMAQANMFQNKEYYNIYDIRNSCQNNGGNGRHSR